jgi:hypothetical protein
MDVDDIATIHVKALDSSISRNRRIFHGPELITVTNVARKIRQEYPQLRARIPEPPTDGDGLLQLLAKFDTSQAYTFFGSQWKGWWESAKATVEDILKYEQRDRFQEARDPWKP